MQKQEKILITGATGMVGSALVRRLKKEECVLLTPTRSELDLCQQTAVVEYFQSHQPQYVYHLAAKVGGVLANHRYPVDFLYANTQMQLNVLHAAYLTKVKKLLFPGSACTYPKDAPQPISESAFLQGPVEDTNLAYATAKINGIVLCQAYAKQYGLNIVIPMPTNAYGINDNFDPEGSHVIPALMQKFHQAALKGEPTVTIWGTGTPIREFIYVDDLAEGLYFLMQHSESSDLINIGSGEEISIAALAKVISDIVGFKGRIEFDMSKPDGVKRKCLDLKKAQALGLRARTSLVRGLELMYRFHFTKNSKFPLTQSRRSR